MITQSTSPSRPTTTGDLLQVAETVEQAAWLDFFNAAPLSVRNGLGLRHGSVGGIGLLACRAIPITEFNRAMASTQGGTPSQRALDDAIAWLDKHASAGWAVQVSPDADVAFLQSLEHRLGLKAHGAWAKFVQALPPADRWTDREPAGAITAQPSRAAEFGATVQAGFGLPPETAAWFSALVGRPRWHCFVCVRQGELVGASAMYVSGAAAWAGMCATLPAFRGRGGQAGLIAARLNAATAAGVRVVTSETGISPGDPAASGASFRNQLRAGFVQAYARSNHRRTDVGPDR